MRIVGIIILLLVSFCVKAQKKQEPDLFAGQEKCTVSTDVYWSEFYAKIPVYCKTVYRDVDLKNQQHVIQVTLSEDCQFVPCFPGGGGVIVKAKKNTIVKFDCDCHSFGFSNCVDEDDCISEQNAYKELKKLWGTVMEFTLAEKTPAPLACYGLSAGVIFPAGSIITYEWKIRKYVYSWHLCNAVSKAVLGADTPITGYGLVKKGTIVNFIMADTDAVPGGAQPSNGYLKFEN